MESSRKANQSSNKRPRFWLGPLVAGGCFAVGYGITQRLISLGSPKNSLQYQYFEEKVFSGVDLETLRNLHDGKSSELLSGSYLIDTQGPMRSVASASEINDFVNSPEESPSVLDVVQSSKVENLSKVLSKQPENGWTSLPSIPWVPRFPSARTFFLPKDLPKVP